MKTEQLYFDDPLCLEFMAEVIGMTTTERGKYGVVLPKTYFYPTSGGQDHDTGKIGDAIVLDVYKMEDGRIIHTLDREITPGLYPASIDRMRRWQNMQAHTAQHILSRAFETELDLETLSANINADTPSTIALNIISSDQYDLLQVEDKANSIIFENRAVKNYYITDNEVSKIPFRKPPKVTGRIRVVEVDGYDYSACGGTHCPRTGMVGVLKILKSEIQNRKLRVYFVAGYQALKVFQNTYATIRELSNNLEIGQEELIMAVQRQTDNLQAVRSELDVYRSQILEIQANQLVESACVVRNLTLIAKILPDKTLDELRKLAIMIRSEEKFVIVLGAIEGKKLSLVVGCSNDLQIDARELLRSLLEGLNGRGGGDQFLAQGGCIVPAEGVGDIFKIARDYIINQPEPAG
jgi:alanyl-tRNA synthetase